MGSITGAIVGGAFGYYFFLSKFYIGEAGGLEDMIGTVAILTSFMIGGAVFGTITASVIGEVFAHVPETIKSFIKNRNR